MKGVLFSVVEEVVVEKFGDDTWDEVLRRAKLDGAYTSLGDYPDTDLGAIVVAVSGLLGVSESAVLVLVGREGFGPLARRHPKIVSEFDSWRDLLVHLDDIIHPEVRKIYSSADAPEFVATTVEAGLLLEYRSRRGLCHLAEGLARGVADWFGTPVEVEHVLCLHRGDAACVLSVTE